MKLHPHRRSKREFLERVLAIVRAMIAETRRSFEPTDRERLADLVRLQSSVEKRLDELERAA